MEHPTILWFRKDLRLEDNAALIAACDREAPVIPLFIYDDTVDQLGAAAQMRLGLSIEALSKRLAVLGSQLILRKGDPLSVLQSIISETGAKAVYWSRGYDPDAIERDTLVKTTLTDAGVDARSFAGHIMFEPWTVETKTGGFYRVYTPFWNAVKTRNVPTPLPAPSRIPSPTKWPATDVVTDWNMSKRMNRGADILRPHCVVGGGAAQDRLAEFVQGPIGDYKKMRDIPSVKATSGLSENLTWGEISPAMCWHAGQHALDAGMDGAEHFLKEVVWREFAYHLIYHTPQITTSNWRPEWDDFPWNTQETPEVIAWKQGRTGIPFVDAAMREMYVTGTMHNRGRMIVASYLTKHLLSHWKIGLDWFADCLIDWDPASNAMGWQWAAGSGPDAAPYFRVFNPVSQLEKFDPIHAYTNTWIAEDRGSPTQTALSYFDAVPRAWGLTPQDRYPAPVVEHDVGRKIALAAYQDRKVG